MQQPLVNITVVAHNRLALTRRTIEALFAHTLHPHVLNVVDNASCDGTREYLRQAKAEGLIHNLLLLERNMGVACACNTGWAAAEADYYLKLDNDMEVLCDDWLPVLLSVFQASPDVGAASYKVVPDACPNTHLFGDLPVWQTEFCGGASLLTSAAVLEDLGCLCEDYGVYGEEDSDFGTRVAMSGRVNLQVEGEGFVRHNEDPEYDQAMLPRKSRAARKKNIEQFQANVHFYDTGLRPLRMERKYLPQRDGDSLSFGLNESYKQNAIHWNRFRKVVCFATEDIVTGHIAAQELRS